MGSAAFSSPARRASPRPPAPEREPDREVSVAQLRRLINEAAIVSTRSPEDASVAVDTLRVLSAQAVGPDRDPAPLLIREVIASLTQCWERGWQPLDVEHVLRRQSTVKAATWVAQAILAEAVQSSAPQRAPQEWCGQLDALAEDIGRVLPAVELLRVGGRATDAEWTTALTVLGWLRALPATQLLMPRPSSWSRVDEAPARSAGTRTASTGTASDPKLLTRIRALLAKAEGTDYPHEAEALTAKAQDLMTRHAIDEALLHAQAGDSITVIGRRIHIDNPYALEKATLLNGVAGANRAQAAWSDFADRCAQHQPVVRLPSFLPPRLCDPNRPAPRHRVRTSEVDLRNRVGARLRSPGCGSRRGVRAAVPERDGRQGRPHPQPPWLGGRHRCGRSRRHAVRAGRTVNRLGRAPGLRCAVTVVPN